MTRLSCEKTECGPAGQKWLGCQKTAKILHCALWTISTHTHNWADKTNSSRRFHVVTSRGDAFRACLELFVTRALSLCQQRLVADKWSSHVSCHQTFTMATAGPDNGCSWDLDIKLNRWQHHAMEREARFVASVLIRSVSKRQTNQYNTGDRRPYGGLSWLTSDFYCTLNTQYRIVSYRTV